MPKRQRVVESDDDEDDAQETFSDSGAEGAPDGHGTGGDAGARGRAAVSMTEVVRAIHFCNQRNAPRESDDISSVVQLLEQLLAISSMAALPAGIVDIFISWCCQGVQRPGRRPRGNPTLEAP